MSWRFSPNCSSPSRGCATLSPQERAPALPALCGTPGLLTGLSLQDSGWGQPAGGTSSTPDGRRKSWVCLSCPCLSATGKRKLLEDAVTALATTSEAHTATLPEIHDFLIMHLAMRGAWLRLKVLTRGIFPQSCIRDISSAGHGELCPGHSLTLLLSHPPSEDCF